MDVNLYLFVADELLECPFILNFLVDDRSIVLYGQLFVIVEMQLEVYSRFLDVADFFGIVELLQVRMFEHLLDAYPPVGVELQHLGDQVHQLGVIGWEHFGAISFPLYVEDV